MSVSPFALPSLAPYLLMTRAFPAGQSDITLEDAEKWIDMLMRQKYPALEPLALAAVMHVVRASYLYARGHQANSTASTAATAAPSTTIDSSSSSSNNTNSTEASSRPMALTRVVADVSTVAIGFFYALAHVYRRHFLPLRVAQRHAR